MNRKIFLLIPLIIFFSQATAQDSLKSSHNQWKLRVYPTGGYQPETSWSLGAIGFIVIKDSSKTNDTYYRPSSLSPYFEYTFKRQLIISSSLDIYFKDWWSLRGKVKYSDFPDQYYGIGNANDASEFEKFTNRFVKADLAISRMLNSTLMVGLHIDAMYNKLYDFEQNGMMEGSSLTGISGGSTIGLGPEVLWDTRDNVLYPKKGYYMNASWTQYDKLMGSKYDYHAFLIDLRSYTTLFGNKNVLALQLKALFQGGGDIPFYKLAKLGGDDRLRGIEHFNLYIDNNATWFQMEGRRPLFWRVGGTLFAGVGNVSPTLSTLFDQLTYVYGIGARYKVMKDEDMNARIDLGFSENGQMAFYFSVKEAF